MPKHKDQLPGGLADDKKPSDFDSKQLQKGIDVEMEHTTDQEMAKEIAMDHLTEDPEYYDMLEKVEKKHKGKRMSDLKDQLIKLGSQNPKLRKHLRPILAATVEPSDLHEGMTPQQYSKTLEALHKRAWDMEKPERGALYVTYEKWLTR